MNTRQRNIDVAIAFNPGSISPQGVALLERWKAQEDAKQQASEAEVKEFRAIDAEGGY